VPLLAEGHNAALATTRYALALMDPIRPQSAHSRSSSSQSTSPKMFGEFPLSIRLAQRSILVAIAIPIVLRTMLRARFGWLQIAIGAASGICALVGLIATYYAVIRYPYMGLVDASDGDLFSKYVESQKKWVLNLAKGVGIVVAISAIVARLWDGQINALDLAIALYAASILVFLVFLAFFYDRADNPTVATFLRCSMGLGIFLYPLFIPALIIGSMRVNVLLDEAILKMEAEKRRGQAL
jgi:glucan phosphoethanolaminetransferase (alkaline phosphatase superfamily)